MIKTFLKAPTIVKNLNKPNDGQSDMLIKVQVGMGSGPEITANES